MASKYIRHIVYFKRYYLDFFELQRESVKTKFNWTLGIIGSLERIPEKYFKHIEDGIYEIRIEVGSDIFRIFSFFDKGQLIILMNGFQKKTPKTPLNEIQLAKKIRKEYFDEK